MAPRLVSILILLAASFGVATPSSAQEAAEQVVAPSMDVDRGTLLEWKTPEGKAYWYVVPKKIKKSEPPALILFLHGTGLDHRWSFWNYGLAKGNYRPDDILVSPDGLTPGNGAFNFVQGKKDGDHIANLIRRFQDEFPISRVYLYGHSQGAFFCYWFAGEYPELVDGIIAHAGNVLDVKHPKLAKEKIAIGILHGEADAVVTVECAYRTHGIYKELGYEKLKLEIVEGLTEQSGHWPLPIQVNAMFTWLDSVSVKTPSQSVTMGMQQIENDLPDLAMIRTAVDEASDLLKKYKGDDRAELESRLAKLQEFLDEARDAYLGAMAPLAESFDPKAEFGTWVSRFHFAHRGLIADPKWQKSMKKIAGVVKKHDKTVAKALEKLGGEADKKAFSNGVKAMEKGYLSLRYPELVAAMTRLGEQPPKGTAMKDRTRLKELLDARRSDWGDGLVEAHEILRQVRTVFVEANRDLFPEPAKDDAK